MEFKIDKSIFHNALNITKRAISSTAPIPALSGILIEVNNDSIKLLGSDSQISILKTLSVSEPSNKIEVIKEGAIVLDNRYITEIVNKMDSDVITIEVIDGTLTKISGNKAEFKINGIKASDYPNITFDINSEFEKVNVSLFETIVRQTAFACSDDEVRPALTGVNFSLKNKQLTCAATDSFRLAKKVINNLDMQDFNITIPSKTLKNVIGIIGNEYEFDVAIDTNKIIFKFSDTVIRGRLIEDIYPDISRLMPANFTQTLEIDAKTLASAADRPSFLKSEGKNIIKMCIDDDQLELYSISQEMGGSSHETIDIISFEGNPINISCNGNFLIDALRTIGNHHAILKFSGELKPIVILNQDDDSLIQLISPIRN